MNILSKISLSALTSAILLCMNTPSFADGGRAHEAEGSHYGYGQPTTVTNLSATLTPGSTAPSGYTGTGRIIFTYNSTNTNGAGSLHASILLPVDGSIIKDSNGAASSISTLTTTSGTACTLSISDINFIYPSSTTTTAAATSITENAEYKLSVSVTGAATSAPALTASIGSCSSVTVPKAGDIVSVAVPVASSTTGATITLTGTFATLGAYH